MNGISLALRFSHVEKEVGITFYLTNETTCFMTCIPFDHFCAAVNDLRESNRVYGRSFAIENNNGQLQFFNRGSGLTFETNDSMVKKFIQKAEGFINKVKEQIDAEAA